MYIEGENKFRRKYFKYICRWFGHKPRTGTFLWVQFTVCGRCAHVLRSQSGPAIAFIDGEVVNIPYYEGVHDDGE